MTDTSFKTSLDKHALLITFGILSMLVFSYPAVFYFGTDEDISLILPLALTVILLFPAIYSPSRYNCKEKTLEIRRLAGTIRIDINDILNVRAAEANELKRVMRLFGSGGLYGYYGKFYDSDHRNFKMYGRRKNNKILVFTKTGLVVLMPDDPDSLLKHLRSGLIKHN